MTPRRLCWPWVPVLLLMAVAGCDSCDEQRRPSPAAATSARAATVAAPQGLMGHLYIEKPTHTWLATRTRLGGATLLLPRSFGGMVVALFGLPLRAVEQLDESAPVVGAAIGPSSGANEAGGTAPSPQTGPEPAVGVAFAIRAKHGRRLLAQLSKGPEAKHTAERAADGVLTWLRPRRAGEIDPWVAGSQLAVLDDYLLLGSSELALQRLGPYLVRNLARLDQAHWRRAAQAAALPDSTATADAAPPGATATSATASPSAPPGSPQLPPTADVLVRLEPSALRGPLRRWLATMGSDVASGPAASMAGLIDVQSMGAAWQEVLDGLSQVLLAVRIQPARVTLTAQLTAAGDGQVLADLSTTPTEQLLELPADTVLATSWLEGEATRRQGAKRSATRLAELFGDDLPSKDQHKLGQALMDLARGRDAQTTAGLRCTGVGLTGFAHGPVRDSTQLARGLDVLTAYRKHPAVVTRLRAADLSLSVRKKMTVPDVPGEVRRFRLLAESADPPPSVGDAGAEPEPIDMLIAAGNRHYWMTAGLQTRHTLQHLVKPDPERSLSQRPMIVNAVRTMGAQVWLALIAEPLELLACRAGQPGTAPPALLTVAAGPTPKGARTDGWLRVEIGTQLLQAATQ